MPYDSLTKIKTLKAIHLNYNQQMLNTYLPESICDWTEMRFFLLTFSPYIKQIPFDCVVNN